MEYFVLAGIFLIVDLVLIIMISKKKLQAETMTLTNPDGTVIQISPEGGIEVHNKFCIKCGSPLVSGAKFCGSCGTQLGGQA